MPNFYLAGWRAGTHLGMPTLSPDIDPAAAWSTIDLRSLGGRASAAGFTLISPSDGGALTAKGRNAFQQIGAHIDDTVPLAVRSKIANALNITFTTEQTVRDILRTLLFGGVGPWGNIAAAGPFYEVWLGNELVDAIPNVSGGMAQVWENFNKANGTALGPLLTWDVTQGAPTIASNQIVDSALGIVDAAKATNSVGSQNMLTQGLVTALTLVGSPTFANNYVAVRTRCSNVVGVLTHYHYEVGWNTGTTAEQGLYETVGGTQTNIAIANVAMLTPPFTIKVVANGSTITGFMGTSTITNTATGVATAAFQQPGFMVYCESTIGHAALDNVLGQALNDLTPQARRAMRPRSAQSRAAQSRRRKEVVPTSTSVITPAFIPQAVRAKRASQVTRRKRGTVVVPAQVAVAAPAFVPQVIRAKRASQVVKRRRGTAVVPEQFAAPDIERSRRVVRTLRRRRPIEVVPTQVIVAPAFIPQVVRARRASQVVKRRRGTEVVPEQLAPLPVVRPKRVAVLRRRRGVVEVVPTQAAVIAPAFIPQAVRARRASQTLRRRRPIEVVKPVGYQADTVTRPDNAIVGYTETGPRAGWVQQHIPYGNLAGLVLSGSTRTAVVGGKIVAPTYTSDYQVGTFFDAGSPNGTFEADVVLSPGVSGAGFMLRASSITACLMVFIGVNSPKSQIQLAKVTDPGGGNLSYTQLGASPVNYTFTAGQALRLTVDLDTDPTTGLPRHRVYIDGALKLTYVGTTGYEQQTGFGVQWYLGSAAGAADDGGTTFDNVNWHATNPDFLFQVIRFARRAALPVRRRRGVEVVPTQAAVITPAFVPQVVRARRASQVTKRRRGAEVVPTQSSPPADVGALRSNAARLRPILARRRRQPIETPPAQVVVAPSAFVPQSIRARVRGATVRRSRRVEVVPTQVVVTPPAFVPQVVRARRASQVTKRRRGAEVVPTQAAVITPAFIPQAVRARRAGQVVKRRRGTAVVPEQIATPATSRPRVRQIPARRRRSRPLEVVPIVEAPPTRPARTARRGLRGLIRRARATFPLGQAVNTSTTPVCIVEVVGDTTAIALAITEATGIALSSSETTAVALTATEATGIALTSSDTTAITLTVTEC